MFKGFLRAIASIILLGILAAYIVPMIVGTGGVTTAKNMPPSQAQQATPKQPAPEIKLSPKDQAQLNRDMADMRAQTARELESDYLDKGMDVHVTTSGKMKDSITFRYVLISRPLVHKIQKDGTLIGRLRQLGFRKAHFTDGYTQTWTFDLTP